jgi:hypothetical protein
MNRSYTSFRGIAIRLFLQAGILPASVKEGFVESLPPSRVRSTGAKRRLALDGIRQDRNYNAY